METEVKAFEERVRRLLATDTTASEQRLFNELIQQLRTLSENPPARSPEGATATSSAAATATATASTATTTTVAQQTYTPCPDDPFPGVEIDAIVPHEALLVEFVSYLFHRRYSKSEVPVSLINAGSAPVAPPPPPASSAPLPPGRHGSLSSARRPSLNIEAETRMAADVNSALEALILWIKSQRGSAPLLHAFLHILDDANEQPMVRNKLVVHVMEWLGSDMCSHLYRTSFPSIQDFIVRGITDVWSAIRKSCATLLFDILDRCPLDLVQPLYAKFIQICSSSGSTWQAVEGGTQGMTTVLRKFNWVTNALIADMDLNGDHARFRPAVAKGDSLTDRSEFCLMYNNVVLRDGLPEVITQPFHSVIFSLLAHKQLSVRENAARAFSAYLSRSDFREALSSLKDIVSRLRQEGVPAEDRKGKNVFLDAYEAEGLLNVCTFIIKHIPPGFLLPHWPFYFTTFDLYLMHPASTVRQATSVVFKYIVAKDSSNPIMLKLVLQGLAAEWAVREGMANTTLPSPGPASPSVPLYSINEVVTSFNLQPSDSWEWREGRLLAYELILKFLVTNHIHYLFPTFLLATPYKPKDDAQGSGRKMKRRLSMPDFHGEKRDASPNLNQSWDGRVTPAKPSSAKLLDVPPEGGSKTLTRVRSFERVKGPATPAAAAAAAAVVVSKAASTNTTPTAATTPVSRAQRHMKVGSGTFSMPISEVIAGSPPRAVTFASTHDDASSSPTAAPPMSPRSDSVATLVGSAHPRSPNLSLSRGSELAISPSSHASVKKLAKGGRERSNSDAKKPPAPLSPLSPLSTHAGDDGDKAPLPKPLQKRNSASSLSALSIGATLSHSSSFSSLHRMSRNESVSSVTVSRSESPLEDIAGEDGAEGLSPLPQMAPSEGRFRLKRNVSRRTKMMHVSLGRADGVQPDQPFRKAAPPSMRRSRKSKIQDRITSLGTGASQGARSLISEVQAFDLELDTSVGAEHQTRPENMESTINLELDLPLADECLASCPRLGSRATKNLLPLSPSLSRRLSISPQANRRETSSPAPLPVPSWVSAPDARDTPAWVDTSKIEAFTTVLWFMLLQTVECMGSTQFELRRMGGMVLPLLTEVIRWFDPNILKEFWSKSLALDSTWMAYTAAIALRQSMAHSTWLTSFFANPPPTWSNIDSCYKVAVAVVMGTKQCVPSIFPLIFEACAREVVDKMSVIACDLLLMLVTNFRDCVPIPDDFEALIARTLARVFLAAHPDAPGRAHLEGLFIDSTEDARVAIVKEGPLGVSAKGAAVRTEQQAGSEALKALVDQTAALLPDFVDMCDLDIAMNLLPLALVLGTQSDCEPATVKLMLESVHRIVDRAAYCYWYDREHTRDTATRPKSPSVDRPPDNLESRLFALSDLTVGKLLESLRKSTDITHLRRTLDLLFTMCVVVSDTRYLAQYLHTIADKTRQSSSMPPLLLTKRASKQTLAVTLQILKPHPSTGTADGLEDGGTGSDSEEEEEDLLSTSRRSLEMSSSHLNLSMAGAENSGSDWDSWDEEEESDDLVLTLMAEYVVNFEKLYASPKIVTRIAAAHGTSTDPIKNYAHVFDSLSDDDQRTLEWLVDKHSK